MAILGIDQPGIIHFDETLRLRKLDGESMGFAKVQGQNNLTAHWTVPEHQKA